MRTTWEIAELFPAQGEWTELDYLALPGNRLVELSEGSIELLPPATDPHQCLVAFMLQALMHSVRPRKLGTVLISFPSALWRASSGCPMCCFC